MVTSDIIEDAKGFCSRLNGHGDTIRQFIYNVMQRMDVKTISGHRDTTKSDLTSLSKASSSSCLSSGVMSVPYN